MKIYDATLRQAGDMLNTVPKRGITAAEVAVLRHLHGPDAVVDIKEVGDRVVNERRERARLEAFYPAKKVHEIFGVPGSMPLPQTAVTVAVDVPEDSPGEDEDEPFIRTSASAGGGEPAGDSDFGDAGDEPAIERVGA